MEQQDNPQLHLDNLREIRSLMERSSRFISLSGFSGIFVGIFALAGEYIAAEKYGMSLVDDRFYHFEQGSFPDLSQMVFPMADAVLVLLASLGIATFLTYRKAVKGGQPVWDATAKRLLMNMMVPLFAGGIFCLALLYQQLYGLIAPATLIFYGMALFSSSKYTFNDIRYLGIMEIALGLAACFALQYQLVCWAIGFGLLHIIYGVVMYYKYER